MLFARRELISFQMSTIIIIITTTATINPRGVKIGASLNPGDWTRADKATLTLPESPGWGGRALLQTSSVRC